jgi:hypothetical protein
MFYYIYAWWSLTPPSECWSGGWCGRSNNRIFHGAMQQAATLASWIREKASLWVHAGVAPSLSLLIQ